MLLFVCDNCKFSSPGTYELCQTCGARLSKSEPVKEIVYSLESTHQESFLASAWTMAERCVQVASRWFQVPTGETTVDEGKQPLTKAVRVSMPPKTVPRAS